MPVSYSRQLIAAGERLTKKGGVAMGERAENTVKTGQKWGFCEAS
jgi:hypothetical protein